MQPLISPVDHESRHSSYRAEDEQPQPTEESPLLRFPQPPGERRSNLNTAVVSVLLIILISGVIIGIYLLIIQNNSENILPPIETPLQLVSRWQWDSNWNSTPVLEPPAFLARQVIVVQTDSQQCHSLQICSKLLQDMEMATANKSLPYNFLLSSNGQTYEAIGWRHSSSLFPQYKDSALVLAFIGNFTEVPPTRLQLDEARNFFAESVSLQHLDTSYVVIGKRTKDTPKYLFQSLKYLPQWDNALSDK